MFLLNVGEFYQATCRHIPEGVFMVTAVRISSLRRVTVSVFKCLFCIRYSNECEYTFWGMTACSLEDICWPFRGTLFEGLWGIYPWGKVARA